MAILIFITVLSEKRNKVSKLCRAAKGRKGY